MRTQPLLLWSLNSLMPNGSIGIDRPDRIGCSWAADSASRTHCVSEGTVVWLGRLVDPRPNESLAQLCGVYRCSAGASANFPKPSISPASKSSPQVPCGFSMRG
jgi:hypothetical protein